MRFLDLGDLTISLPSSELEDLDPTVALDDLVQGKGLQSVRVTELDLRDISLASVNLRNVLLVRPLLAGCRLDEAQLDTIAVVDGDLMGAQTSGFSAKSAVFLGCRFDYAGFSLSEWQNSGWLDCTFKDADLSGCRLTRVCLLGSTFDGAEVAGSRFRNVDVRGSEIGMSRGLLGVDYRDLVFSASQAGNLGRALLDEAGHLGDEVEGSKTVKATRAELAEP